jgi:glycosyltransferase involved in cell wall biosynthesis
MLAINGQSRLSRGRGDVVICLDAGADAAVAAAALSGVIATVQEAGDVTVALYGSPEVLVGIQHRLAAASGRNVWLAPDDRPGGGFAMLAAAAAPADLVLVGAGARLAPGWLGELSAAARSDAVIATASALGAAWVDAGAEPGLIGRAGGEPGLADRLTAGEAVAPGSLRRLDGPAGPCVYVRRSAIELVGLAPPAGFARRCRERGLAHVLAENVIAGGAPVTGLIGLAGTDAATGADAADGADSAAGVSSARLRARSARGELAVVIDARRLSGPLDGTRVHLCELIGAVARTQQVEVTALLPAQLGSDTRRRLDQIAGVRSVGVDAAGRPPAGLRADVVHRPHQVESYGDLTLLAGLAPRLVLTQQDLIGFHAPDYFASAAAWQGYRELTRLALASADRVLFFSRHARAEALAAELVEPTRADVVTIGTDPTVIDAGGGATRPGALAGLGPQTELILCLGTDMRHKNREFALALAAQLRRAHAWAGTVVFAGPHVPHGSSRAAEARRLAADPDLADTVVDLGEVSDAERRWLLARATLVLYPTVHEGFGLVPYEAAARGVPCLWAPGTALAELLGEAAGQIVPWDPVAGADRALALMRDPVARAAQVAEVVSAAAQLSWAETGRALLAAYHAACERPPSTAGAILRASSVMNAAVSPDGMALVGPDGLLPADVERPLLAVLSHPGLAAPVLGALRWGYRLARRRAEGQ